jgi:hypothetical protein
MVVVGQVGRRIRFRSRSVLARSYIRRLSILMRLALPSGCWTSRVWLVDAQVGAGVAARR